MTMTRPVLFSKQLGHSIGAYRCAGIHAFKALNYSTSPPKPVTPVPATTPPVVVVKTTPPAPIIKPAPPRGKSGKPFKWGLLFGLVSGIVLGVWDNGLTTLEDNNTIQPPTKSDPFPKNINLQNTEFECIGVGVRTVSFLRIHVYALGIYIATADLQKAKTALIASDATQESLFDDEKSIQVIDALLAAGVRVAVRITPVRNTEFSHLRDGFVRSIMSHPMFKELDNDSFGQGLADLKRAFSRKRKAPKQDTIYMVRTPTGGLDAIYTPKEGETENLGHVEDINVARVFFLQYLSGKSPNSPTARESAVQGLLTLTA